jgi:uncharacterized protein YbbC (DUF1343 family)
MSPEKEPQRVHVHESSIIVQVTRRMNFLFRLYFACKGARWMSKLGIEVLLTQRRELLRGRTIGVVSNYNVTDSLIRPIISLLVEDNEWTVAKLFGPEHGVKNSAKEGEEVDFTIDEATGLPAYSLYGRHKKPTPEMLEGLDVLVFDLVDIGARYYTNMNTLAYCMEACAEAGLPIVVLDRPNPIGGETREGNILNMEYASFVGMHPIPNRHGLTMGELAMFFQSRLSTPCDLTVVRMSDWKRSMLLSDTGIPFVPSSPNTTCLDMCLLYPGTCFFEGVNVSVGRGTTHPFEQVGAPYIRGHQLSKWFSHQGLPGVVARPAYFTPTYSQYTGELCEGVFLHMTDPRTLEPVKTGITLLQGIATLYSEKFEFLGVNGPGKPFIDLLAGNSRLREYIVKGEGLSYLEESRSELEQFNQDIQAVLLYD